MTAHTVKRLQSLTDEQLKQLWDLSEQAFADDPMIASFLGGDYSLSCPYWNSIYRATVLEGELWVVTVKNTEGKEVIASCASWFAPGKALFATEAQRAEGYNDFFNACSEKTRIWLGKTYPALMEEFVNKLFVPEDRTRYWWCFMLATHPAHQKKGYGTALVDIGYQKAYQTRESGTFAGLAASNEVNVHIYQGMGFKLQGSIDVPSSIDGTLMRADALIKRP